MKIFLHLLAGSMLLAQAPVPGPITGGGGPGGAANIPSTPNLLKGDGFGGAAAATALDLSAANKCIAASASGTAYTCTTSPSFVPAIQSTIQFRADVDSAAGATIAVNGAAAATIKKQGGSANLVLKDFLAGQWSTLVFDGTNWQMLGQSGNAGGGSVATTASVLKGNNAGGAIAAVAADIPIDYTVTQAKIVINAKMSCGVTGDNVTDDSTAINTCLTGAAGGEVHFTPGTYFIGTTGVVLVTPNVAIVGDGGKGAVTFRYIGAGGGITVGAYGSTVINSQVRNISVNMDGSAAGSTGFHLIQTQDSTLRNNTVTASDNGAATHNFKTCFWLDGGNSGIASDFGTGLLADGNDCRTGAWWMGIRIDSQDATFNNAYTHIDWTNGRIVSNTGTKRSAAYTITNATNAGPIVITLSSPIPAYLSTGLRYIVFITGVNGNTNANGYSDANVIDSTHLSLFNSGGNGAYTSGGTLYFSAVGIKVERGSEFRGSPDIENFDLGMSTQANYVGCVSARLEGNNLDWQNGVWDNNCITVAHIPSYQDFGTHTRIIGSAQGDVLPNLTMTYSPVFTGDTGGGGSILRARQYAHQGFDDAGIHNLGNGVGGYEVLDGGLVNLGVWHYKLAGSNSESRPTCDNLHEGAPWYALGSGGSNGSWAVCQNQSGTYTWVAQNTDGASCATPTFTAGGTTTVSWAGVDCAIVTASGGNTTLAFSNPHGSGPYSLILINDTTARAWTMPANFKQALAPAVASAATFQTITYDGTNYQGNGSSEAPSVIRMSTERSAPAAAPTADGRIYADSTDHDLEFINATGSVYKMFLTGVDTNPVTGTLKFGPGPSQTSVTDIWSNGTTGGNPGSTTENGFATSFTLSAASTASTLDGTHKSAVVSFGGDVFGNNSATAVTRRLRACPVANWSAGVCSAGSSLLWASASSTYGGTTLLTSMDQFAITATGTAGTFMVQIISRPVALGQAPATSQATLASNCTACTGGSWVLYYTAQFATAATGTSVCAGVTTGGTVCIAVEQAICEFKY